MHFLLSLSRGIDRLNRQVGRVTFVAMVIVVLVGAYNAVARKLESQIDATLTSNAM
ncbi:MAG: hypothetical protein KDC38_11790 [Planctomycetes bacterium]|nr:hypothetical protein [Planctomycetota bacterium]